MSSYDTTDAIPPTTPTPPPAGSRVERIQPYGNITPPETAYWEYINTALQTHIDNTLHPYDRGNAWTNLQVSQGFYVNGNPDTNLRFFFVTHNDRYIGFLMVTYYNEKFISSSGIFANANVSAVISDNTPVAIIELPSGRIFMQTEEDIFHLAPFDHIIIDFGGNYPDIFGIAHEKAVIVFSYLE